VDSVLAHFGKQMKAARRHYRRFIQGGIAQGKREALTGGGLLRGAGGWGALKSRRLVGDHFKGDERILGDSAFVEKVFDAAQEGLENHYLLSAAGVTFDSIAGLVWQHFDMPSESILAPGKQPLRFKATSVVAYLAARHLGKVGTDVGKRLGVGKSAVSRAVERGKRLPPSCRYLC
jgi:hypothetical protein